MEDGKGVEGQEEGEEDGVDGVDLLGVGGEEVRAAEAMGRETVGREGGVGRAGEEGAGEARAARTSPPSRYDTLSILLHIPTLPRCYVPVLLVTSPC